MTTTGPKISKADLSRAGLALMLLTPPAVIVLILRLPDCPGRPSRGD